MDIFTSYQIYETKARFYISAYRTEPSGERLYHILKVDRTTETELTVTQDPTVYSERQWLQVLLMIEEGNKSTGGVKRWPEPVAGILGFIRFLKGYYMIVITKCSKVALIAGHYIYHIDETVMVPVYVPLAANALSSVSSTNPNNDSAASASAPSPSTAIPDPASLTSSSSAAATTTTTTTSTTSAATLTSAQIYERNQAELRYVDMFNRVELTKNFYFCHSYDLTRTFQANLTEPETETTTTTTAYHDMFVWNYELLVPAFGRPVAKSCPWALPVIHGFVDQCKIDIYGKCIYFTLLARRSRHFAGARYMHF